MRSSNGHLAHGTTGNPQGTLEQETLAAISTENERQLKGFAKAQLIDETLVEELRRQKVKFNLKDMVFITRDKTGQTIWLEKGADAAGLAHLEKRGHIKDLADKFGVDETSVPFLMRNIIKNGAILSSKTVIRRGREGIERIYEYEGRRIVLAAIDANGFLVSMYPI